MSILKFIDIFLSIRKIIYQPMTKKNNIIIATGDIHGSISALNLLLSKIESHYSLKKVKLLFLGDYSDRGENTSAVLDRLIKLKEEFQSSVFLMGNHEEMILAGIPFEISGFNISHRQMNFIRSLKLFYKSENFVFVHGGIPAKHQSPESVSPHDLVWAYGPWPGYAGPKVICGHLPEKEVRDTGTSLCIDTGCCFKMYGTLTAAVLNDNTGKTMELIQVENPIFNV